MLNKLFNLISVPIGKTAILTSILSSLESLLEHFEQDYFKDKDAKNAAIDCIIEFLQENKHK